MVSFLSNLWLGTVFQRRVHENKVVTIYIALPSGHFDAGFASVLVCNQARALLLGSGSWVCHPLICGVIPPSCTIAAYGAVILWCCDSMSAPRYAAVPCLGTRGVQRACCKLQQMLQTASWRTFFQPLRGSDLQSLNKVRSSIPACQAHFQLLGSSYQTCFGWKGSCFKWMFFSESNLGHPVICMHSG